MSARDTSILEGPSRFPSTSMHLILSARGSQEGARKGHLERLFANYWKPVYFFIRRVWSKNNNDAKDLTQEFFISLLEYDALGRFEPDKGNFRPYLLRCLRNFLTAAKRDQNRLKRGGGRRIFSLEQGEPTFADEVPSASLRPEQEFELDWIREVLRHSLKDMEEHYRRRERMVVFDVYRMLDMQFDGGRRPSYREVATRLGISSGDVCNHLKAARRELRSRLRARVIEYVADAREVTEEEYRILGSAS